MGSSAKLLPSLLPRGSERVGVRRFEYPTRAVYLWASAGTGDAFSATL